MFKILYNNTVELFIIVFTATLLSCDGRDRIHKTNAEVLTENNLFDAFSEQVTFVPNAKVEIVTDTILSNGFQVKIKYNSLEQSSVLETTKTQNNTITKTHHKDFEAKLNILKNGIIINQSIINKNIFQDFESASFWKRAIMQYVWIDYEASTNHILYLNTSFNIPNTETYKDFILKIDEYGVIQIKEKKYSAKIS